MTPTEIAVTSPSSEAILQRLRATHENRIGLRFPAPSSIGVGGRSQVPPMRAKTRSDAAAFRYRGGGRGDDTHLAEPRRQPVFRPMERRAVLENSADLLRALFGRDIRRPDRSPAIAGSWLHSRRLGNQPNFRSTVTTLPRTSTFSAAQ